MKQTVLVGIIIILVIGCNKPCPPETGLVGSWQIKKIEHVCSSPREEFVDVMKTCKETDSIYLYPLWAKERLSS